jgi:uncharacterized membrane protein YfcA
MLLGSAPFSLLGVQVAEWLQTHYGDGVESISAKVIGAALLLGGVGVLAKTFVKRGIQPDDAPFLLARRDRMIAFALGVSGGFIVGLTSVGSGTFFALVMLLVFPLTAVKIVGTDIFHAAALLWVAGLSHLLHGNVDLGAMGWLLIGSVPGVLLGSRLTVRFPDRSLRVGLAGVLLLSGIKLLDVPASDAIVVVALVAGAVLGLILFLRWIVNGRHRRAPVRA